MVLLFKLLEPTRAAAVIAAVILTSCTGAPTSPGSRPPASPAYGAASAAPSSGPATAMAPSPDAEPSPEGYEIGTPIQVVADAVRLRSAAGLEAAQVGSLVRGEVAVITDGPTEVDGHAWYAVAAGEIAGWLAAGDGADPWIAELPEMPSSELLFRFAFGCDVTGPLQPPAFTLTADRRIVSASLAGDDDWQVGRLSAEGLSEVLAMTVERPELERSAEFLPERRPGTDDPPGHGGCGFTFTLHDPANRVVVTSTSWFGDEEEAAYYLSSPERKALDELARQLMEGTGFLGPGAWDEPPAQYASSSYLAWIIRDDGAPSPDLPHLTDGDIGDPEVFGEAVERGRCGYLTPGELEGLRTAVLASGQQAAMDAVSYLALRTDTAWYTIITSPRTPDGYPTCADLLS